MGQTVTVAEAILISIATVLVWAFIKTILEYIEESANNKVLPPKKFNDRNFTQYQQDLWYGDESQDEITNMIKEAHGRFWKDV